MRQIILSMLFLFFAWGLCAQSGDEGTVTGRVVNREGRGPVQGVRVSIMTVPQKTTATDANGCFEFERVPYGVYNISIEAVECIPVEISVRVDTEQRDTGTISLLPDMEPAWLDDAYFVEFDMENENGGMPSPALLAASRDPFDNITGYKFSPMRFTARGYGSGSKDIHINGIRLNDALTGYSPWSLWSGLNEAVRNQESVAGLSVSDFGIGGTNGVTNIDSRASMLRHGLRGSVVTADAIYRLRLMLTYSSGFSDSGWAYAFSLSARLGHNEHIDGVYYNAYGYYAAVEKLLGDHRLSLTLLGVPTERGVQMGSTQEVYNMVGSNLYNPGWGWQEGRMRNSRVRNYHEPLAIFNYNYDSGGRTRFGAAASFRFGENGYSALDWYDARDPRPDYHRNLPSYYFHRGEEGKAQELWEQWTADEDMGRLDWGYLYDVNRNSSEQWFGPDGAPLGAGRSKYILSERHADQRDFNFRAQLTHEMGRYGRLNAGLAARINRSEYYAEVEDLLGGTYWLNVDNYVQRDYGLDWEKMPNDTSGADNLVAGVGDKYGYDYYAHVRDYSLWGVYDADFGQWQAYLGGEAGYNTFWREGLYRKGLFPDNSLGESERPGFFTYKAKAGAGYRPTGRHHVALNAVAMQQAPYFQNAFISPRTRGTLMEGISASKTYGVEANYNFRSPWLSFRLSGYYTVLKEGSRLISFYDDTASPVDEAASTGAFTNLAMTGIDQRHYGVELGFNMPLTANFTLSGALSLGDYTYTSEPSFTQTLDSSDKVLYEGEKIMWKGYRVEGTPQLAANLSINYRTDSYWYFGLDFNYFDYNYLNMNPFARSSVMYGMVKNEDSLHEIRSQEKFDPAMIVNASIGKSWYIDYKYLFGFSLEIKNILAGTGIPLFSDIRTGGFEQMRIRTPRAGDGDYSAFDPKYFYLPGTNYYLYIYFRF